MDRSLPKGKAIRNVARVLLVASGKGGVGKSTVAVNLAVSMARLGQRIGLLDADMYGPSLPRLLGLTPGRLIIPQDDKGGFNPIAAHGIWSMSMGFLVKPEEGLAWRGLILMRALQQLLFEVRWPEQLDCLVVDMPPGTGDTLLSVAQEVKPLWGCLLVTTGHRVALEDVQRGIRVLNKLQVPLLGAVNNMAALQCPCGLEHRLGGDPSHLQAMLTEHAIPLLATIPLAVEQIDANERGLPMPISHPDHPVTAEYLRLAQHFIK